MVQKYLPTLLWGTYKCTLSLTKNFSLKTFFGNASDYIILLKVHGGLKDQTSQVKNSIKIAINYTLLKLRHVKMLYAKDCGKFKDRQGCSLGGRISPAPQFWNSS